MKFKVKLFKSSFLNHIHFHHIAAVRMARESNITVIQTLQKELDTYLQQVREYTERDTQLNTSIGTLQ